MYTNFLGLTLIISNPAWDAIKNKAKCPKITFRQSKLKILIPTGKPPLAVLDTPKEEAAVTYPRKVEARNRLW